MNVQQHGNSVQLLITTQTTGIQMFIANVIDINLTFITESPSTALLQHNYVDLMTLTLDLLTAK